MDKKKRKRRRKSRVEVMKEIKKSVKELVIEMTEGMSDKRESDKRLKEELRGIREEMSKRRVEGVERRSKFLSSL